MKPLAVGLGGLLLLAGCAPPPRLAVPLPVRPAPRAFAIRGWLGVRTPSGRGGFLHLSWRVAGARSVLLATSTFGAAGFLLEGRPGNWCLRTSRRPPRRVRRLRRFLARWLGFDVPLEDVRDWLFAVPVPGRPSYVRYDPHGRVRLLRQGDWSVRYRRYTTLAGRALPGRLRLEHRGFRLWIGVERWTIGAGAGSRAPPGGRAKPTDACTQARADGPGLPRPTRTGI